MVITAGGGGGRGRNWSGTHDELARVSRRVSAAWSTCLSTKSATFFEYFWTSLPRDES